MSCRRESLLTNSTREPGATVSSFGETISPDPIVITFAFDEGGGVGDDGLPPPHEAAHSTATPRTRRPCVIRTPIMSNPRARPSANGNRALQGGVGRVVVIVEPAGARGRQRVGQPRLAGADRAKRVDRGALEVRR